MNKTIEYYSKEVYGNRLEYVINKDDAHIIRQLTGKKTITGIERELIRDVKLFNQGKTDDEIDAMIFLEDEDGNIVRRTESSSQIIVEEMI